MKSHQNKKYKLFVKFLVFCFISLFVICIFITNLTNIITTDTEGVVQIEHINASIQRIVKLELENVSDDESIEIINTTISNLFSEKNSSKYFITDENIHIVFYDFIDEWYILEQAILNFRDHQNKELLISLSENNYNKAINALETASKYIENLTNKMVLLQCIACIYIIVIIIALINILRKTILELNQNKELNKSLDIDSLTGLYNISKCQEILDFPVEQKHNKDRAVVVLDINYLRKINEEFGHETGDMVILTFATILKKAVKVSPYETFFGRCGGDEFMVYFPIAIEKDIELYIDELKFLCRDFNSDKNNKFKLNYSVGYGITTEKTKSFTNRVLFDIADKYMFEHKIAMKELVEREIKST